MCTGSGFLCACLPPMPLHIICSHSRWSAVRVLSIYITIILYILYSIALEMEGRWEGFWCSEWERKQNLVHALRCQPASASVCMELRPNTHIHSHFLWIICCRCSFEFVCLRKANASANLMFSQSLYCTAYICPCAATRIKDKFRVITASTAAALILCFTSNNSFIIMVRSCA